MASNTLPTALQENVQRVPDWYRLGDGYLGIDSDDLPLRQRFQQLYRECSVVSPTEKDGPRLKCTVRSLDGVPFSLVTFEDPEPLDPIDFTLSLFSDRGYSEILPPVASWRLLSSPTAPAKPLMAFRGTHLLVDCREPWQSFVANYAINRLLRLQRNLLFFHAASVGICGGGALLSGPKGTGKSTISMTLAARGHDFLGDEVAAVRTGSCELVPFRRSTSIRPGPRVKILDELLKDATYESEVFPDGTTRIRADVGNLFPASPARAVRLRTAFFLRQLTTQARVKSFTPTLRDLCLLAPLRCTLWGVSPKRRLMDFLVLLSKVRCYFLDVGSPEETADLIEKIMEV